MKTFKRISLIILSILLWTAFIAFGLINGFLLQPIISKNTPEAFVEATKEKIGDAFVGNFAMTLIENGVPTKPFFYSVDQTVDEHTLFPVASISKWVTSFGVLKLVEQGKVDLDKPVEDYLTRWQLPESEFDHKKVTIRKLLSHSSGLVDDLGYAGFTANQPVQTIEESLIKAADAPYSEGVARIGYEPGTKYMYSGAAYTILQLLIEEVSGQSFQDYMTKMVFEPLGMDHSTFVLNEKTQLKLAQVYKNNGTTRPINTFTALAAASLFTCTEDLSKFLLANISSNQVLSQETITEMSAPETFIGDIGIYGLGPHLYSQNDQHSNIIGHDGSDNDAINTAARIDLQSKNGIIILETGHYDIASSMADEWIFWKAGIADYVVIQRNKPFLLTLLAIGYAIIFIAAFFIIRKKKKTYALDSGH